MEGHKEQHVTALLEAYAWLACSALEAPVDGLWQYFDRGKRDARRCFPHQIVQRAILGGDLRVDVVGHLQSTHMEDSE